MIDKGQVAERGEHGELLARGGMYAAMWEAQKAAAAGDSDTEREAHASVGIAGQ